jgi:transcriptional regulator with XRE-family HTH domain
LALKDNLKKFRKENNLTQEDVAKAIGSSATYVGQIEKGEKPNVGIKYIEPMAKLFKVSIETLIN